MSSIDFRRDVLTFLTSIRYSLDRQPARGRLSNTDILEDHIQRLLLVDEARHRFNNISRYSRLIDNNQIPQIVGDLKIFVERLEVSLTRNSFIGNLPFRMTPPVREEVRHSPLLTRLNDEKITIRDAIAHFAQYLYSLNDVLATKDAEHPIERLRHIVPAQQIAPAQFQVVKGRITVLKVQSKAGKDVAESAAIARDYIHAQGKDILDALNNSNCDRRLIECVNELVCHLNNDSNIIKIGLQNLNLSIMTSQFHSELPDALAGMMISYNASISHYAAQFPDWNKFVENARSIDIDEDDVDSIDRTASDLIDALRENPDLSDVEVPRTIAFIREFIRNPGRSSKKAAYAVIRTIENLVSSILSHSLVFLGDTASKLNNDASTVAAATIMGLVSIAMVGAVGAGPAAVQAGAPWLTQAAEIVQRQLNRISE